jgi:flagellar basal-body rod protein FlgG
MWTSLRTAVTGLMAQQRALDVSADNLTKMQVPGSKGQRVSFLELAPELRYLGVPDGEGNVQVDAREVGVGVRTSSSVRNMTQGSFLPTGDPMDVAIDGDGFLEVTLSGGQAGYAHGGSLRIDATRRLVTSSGLALSPAITVPDGMSSVEIKPDGAVIGVATDGTRQEIGQFRLVRFANPEGLQQIGQNVLVPTVASGAPIDGAAGQPGVGTIVSGIIEASNIDPREEYLRVVQAQRAYELNVRALKTVDEMLADANNLRRG